MGISEKQVFRTPGAQKLVTILNGAADFHKDNHFSLKTDPVKYLFSNSGQNKKPMFIGVTVDDINNGGQEGWGPLAKKQKRMTARPPPNHKRGMD